MLQALGDKRKASSAEAKERCDEMAEAAEQGEGGEEEIPVSDALCEQDADTEPVETQGDS